MNQILRFGDDSQCSFWRGKFCVIIIDFTLFLYHNGYLKI